MAGYTMDGSVPLYSVLLVLVSEHPSQLHRNYSFSYCIERRFRRVSMKTLRRWGLVSFCAMASAVAALGLVWFSILKMEPSLVAQKLSLDRTLYIFPVLILAEFYWFMNDLLAYPRSAACYSISVCPRSVSPMTSTYVTPLFRFGVSFWECIRLRLRCCCSVPR
jgi:hypothetical protein